MAKNKGLNSAIDTTSDDPDTIKQAQEEYAKFFAFSPDMMCILNLQDGTFKRFNPAFMTLLDYEAAFIVQTRFLDMVHPEDRDHTADWLTRSPQTAKNLYLEHRCLHKNGGARWIAWTASYDVEHDLLFMVGRDITEQKATEARLQLSSSALEATTTGVTIADALAPDMPLIYSNAAFSRISGYTQPEIINQNCRFLQNDDRDQSALEEIRAALKEGRSCRVMLRNYRKDGTLFWNDLRISPIYDEDGVLHYFVGVQNDITDQKRLEEELRKAYDELEAKIRERTRELQAANDHLEREIAERLQIDAALQAANNDLEQRVEARTAELEQTNHQLQQEIYERIWAETALKESEARLRAVMRNFPNGVIMVFDKQLRLLLADGTDLAEFGLAERDSADKQPIGELFAAEMRPIIEQAFTQALAGEEFTGEIISGGQTYALLSHPVRDPDDNIIAGMAITQDITVRKEAEAQIQAQNEALLKANRELAIARKQAEESTRLKSEFLATMSHELRTPLNAIIGYTEIQLAGMTGALNEEQTDYQKRVLANGENLLKLINDVLDLSKIEAGRVQIARKPFEPRAFLDELMFQVKGLADDKKIHLISGLDPHLPATLIGDPERLKQIGLNLLSNAIKFTDEGQVHIEMRPGDHQRWELVVSDTGMGIPPHAQEIIFEEFLQVDGTSRREHGGTGLGLSIVRKLTTLMGGTVHLTSRVGEGSTFVVNLPLLVESSTQKGV
ncbi:MAG: PAS domain S-box protein [Anaerolineales bacterium]